MSIDGQEILVLHDLGYRFTDRIDGLSCLQVQVLIEAMRYRNEMVRESLSIQSDSGAKDVRPLDELIHILPRKDAAVEGSSMSGEPAEQKRNGKEVMG
ncbi:MAG: hypothetical protein QXR62_05735 [Candidatus Bathyarchaeia archaeon]